MSSTTVERPTAGLSAIQLPAPSRTRPGARRRALQLLRPREGAVAFLAATAGYLVTGALLVLHYGVIDIDAMSRVANASYVLDSRYPHLAAIGFVWNPLPSLADLPLVPFAHFWPVLKDHAFAGSITSALFMAGAVVLLLGILRDFGCSRPVRYGLTLLFALNPMIVLYGSTGMSEASLLFTLMLATKKLAQWLRTGEPRDLVHTGLALGLAYMARYEALAPGVVTIGLVGVIAFVRARNGIKHRMRDVAIDALLVGFPFVVSVGLWAVTSKVIVKSWFPTITSSYGNSAQVSHVSGYLKQVTGQGTPEAFNYMGHQLFGLAPTLIVTAAIAITAAIMNRDNRALAPIVMLGSVLAFDATAFLSGHSFGWLRFYITAIPLGVLLAACLPAARVHKPRVRPRRALAAAGLTSARLIVNGLLACGAFALVATTLPSTWHTMMNHRYGREEARDLTAIFYPARARLGDKQALNGMHVERGIAHYLDSLHLPNGAVLTDSGKAYGVLMATKDLHAFTITSDLDFERALADPPRFGIHYLLVPDKDGYDAINEAYPGFFDNGGGFAVKVRGWKGYGYSPSWRLYKVTAAAFAADHDTLG
jgi:hypothetical protein